MYKRTWIIPLGMMVLLMGGCTIPKTENQGAGGDQAQQKPTPGKTPEQPKAQFKEPTEPGKPPTPSVNVSGLIPQTPPDKVNPQMGRPDPFALMPVQPKISIDPEKAKEKSPQDSSTNVPKIPAIPNPPTGPETKPGNITPPVKTGQPGREIPSLTPTANNGPGFAPSLPVIPDPALAKEVAVTGVIEVNGVPQIILQAPGEPSSRYVRVGEYISNGQVLVKRVEMNRGSVPVVILEQFGLEVARAVGQPPELPSEQTETPSTASLPSLPFLPNS